MKNLTWLAFALVAAACGDNIDPGILPDSGPHDAPPDTTSFVPPTPMALPLSAAGPDQLQSAVAGPSGSFYAAGFAAPDLAGNKAVVVVKLTSTGALDTTFGGGDGIADTGLVFKGGTNEIDVATQSDGKLIISATVAATAVNVADAADTDVAVVRLDADGAVDPSFGTAGKLVVSFNESFLDLTPDPDVVRGRDAVRGLAIGPSDQIFLHGVQRGTGNITGGITPRIDTDFVVARITAAGVLDASYGTAGTFVLDIYASATHSNATPHAINVLSDGSVIASGYANSAAVGNTTQPVMYKVNPAGTALDTSFAEQGLFHDIVLAMQTEIYSIVLHGTTIVTAGYGRNAGSANDWVSMKFNATTGVREMWGTLNGTVVIDPSGTMAGSNCRNAVALPSGSTVLIGSAGPASLRDAAFAVITSTGALDPAFGDGVHTFDIGAGPEDQFWGGAVSGGKLLIVGWRGGGATPSATMNDDSYMVLMTL